MVFKLLKCTELGEVSSDAIVEIKLLIVALEAGSFLLDLFIVENDKVKNGMQRLLIYLVKVFFV